MCDSIFSSSLKIEGGPYDVVISDTHIKIGCRNKSFAEWARISPKIIGQVDGEAAEIAFRHYMPAILALARANLSYSLKGKD